MSVLYGSMSARVMVIDRRVWSRTHNSVSIVPLNDTLTKYPGALAVLPLKQPINAYQKQLLRDFMINSLLDKKPGERVRGNPYGRFQELPKHVPIHEHLTFQAKIVSGCWLRDHLKLADDHFNVFCTDFIALMLTTSEIINSDECTVCTEPEDFTRVKSYTDKYDIDRLNLLERSEYQAKYVKGNKDRKNVSGRTPFPELDHA